MNSVDSQTSRRTAMKTGLALIGGAIVTFAATVRAGAQEKIAQAMVQYQNMPKENAKCSVCVNWVAPNACKIVAGTINPEGWCVAFAPKES
ncbi:hypothetical protein [Acidisphaera sp. L21]|jgi:hypothetical protein|uniref:hypothetical protein n=1 Tax=Acidisphaera sp. L21 TaxID=1641851 RepID=UPI00131C88E4|nr:hypothetical protein [Acidisphaera sp. L21]